jgi:hypothetical protein
MAYSTLMESAPARGGDLAPCGQMDGSCEPGYVLEGECADHDYHIGPTKGAKVECGG